MAINWTHTAPLRKGADNWLDQALNSIGLVRKKVWFEREAQINKAFQNVAALNTDLQKELEEAHHNLRAARGINMELSEKIGALCLRHDAVDQIVSFYREKVKTLTFSLSLASESKAVPTDAQRKAWKLAAESSDTREAEAQYTLKLLALKEQLL